MTYRYAAFVLGLTQAFNRVWRLMESADPDAQAFIDRLKELAKTQHRKLARSVHPDTGGSTEKMTELNLALECLEDLAIRPKPTPCPLICKVKIYGKTQHQGTNSSYTTYRDVPFVSVRYAKKP